MISPARTFAVKTSRGVQDRPVINTLFLNSFLKTLVVCQKTYCHTFCELRTVLVVRNLKRGKKHLLTVSNYYIAVSSSKVFKIDQTMNACVLSGLMPWMDVIAFITMRYTMGMGG